MVVQVVPVVLSAQPEILALPAAVPGRPREGLEAQAVLLPVLLAVRTQAVSVVEQGPVVAPEAPTGVVGAVMVIAALAALLVVVVQDDLAVAAAVVPLRSVTYQVAVVVAALV